VRAAPKVTQVRQAPPGCDLNCFDLARTQACGLEWVIQDRLNTYFRQPESWPQSMLGRTVIDEVQELRISRVCHSDLFFPNQLSITCISHPLTLLRF